DVVRRRHRDVRDAFQDRLHDHRDAVYRRELLRLLEGRAQFTGVGHPDRLAAQALRDLDVVDAVDAQLGAVDVLELQVDLEVDVEGPLRLADQAQVGVVDQDVDVGDAVLRADRELLDHELEVVVAGEGHHLRAGVGLGHAQRGGDRPAQRAGLAAVDPVPGPVDVQQLGARDLGEADRGDVAGLRAEGAVHLLVDALRLDGDVVEVRPPLEGGPAVLSGRRPGGAVGQPALRAELLRGLDEQLQRGTGVGGDAVVRGEDAADLGGFDVDVDEGAAGRVDVDAPGVAVGPAVADAEHEVGLQEGRVAVAVRGLEADHAGVELVVVGDDAPAHEGGHDGHAGQFGELDEEVGGVRADDAAARDDQRTLGRVQQGEGLLDLGAGGGGAVDRQRLVGVGVELNLRLLDVDRQVDQHGAGPPGAHQVERLLEDARHRGRLQHGDRPLGEGRVDRGDVDGLEVLLVDHRGRGLAGDAQDWHGVAGRGVQAGDHVGAGGAGGADADTDVAGPGAGVALGHVRGALHMAGEGVGDAAGCLERRVEGVDRRAGNAER